MRKAFLDCEESFLGSGEPLYDGLDRQKRACTIPLVLFLSLDFIAFLLPLLLVVVVVVAFSFALPLL